MKTLLLLCLMAPFDASADDYLWLEQEWISDADATEVANRAMFDALSAKTRARYKGLFGKMRWTIADGTLTSKLPDGKPSTATYAIRPVDSEWFEIILRDTDGRYQTVMQIHRTQRGFCATPYTQQQIDEFESANAPISVECFQLYGG